MTDADPPRPEHGTAAASDEQRRGFGPDRRAVSFTVSYILTVALALALVSVVLLATGETVQDRREATVRDVATVAADRTASAVMDVDRLVQAGNDTDGATNASVGIDLPKQAANEPYRITLADLPSGTPSTGVAVRSETVDVFVVVPVVVETDITNGTVTGGEARVVYRPPPDDDITLEAAG